MSFPGKVKYFFYVIPNPTLLPNNIQSVTMFKNGDAAASPPNSLNKEFIA